LDFVAERVSSFSFRDIDDSYDEYSIGWVSVANMFDSAFNYSSHLCGDYVVLSLSDRRAKSLVGHTQETHPKEEERVKREKQIPKIGRSMKVEIRERIRTEQMRKAIPLPSVYDVCWNLADSTLFFFSTNKKAQTVLEDFFKESFGLLLRQQTPYTIAEQLLTGRLSEKLPSLSPAIFL